MSSLQWGYTAPHHAKQTHGNLATTPKLDDNYSAKSDFLEFLKLSPAEQIRELILKEMGLTSEDLNNLPPEARKKVEEDILEKMKERLSL